MPGVEACKTWLRAQGWRLVVPPTDDVIEVYGRADVVDDLGAPLWLHLPVRGDAREAAHFVEKLVGLVAVIERRSEAAIVAAICEAAGGRG